MSITCVIHSGTPLVCPTCLAIERGRMGGKGKRGTGAPPRPRQEKPANYSAKDCLAAFRSAPELVFRADHLVLLAPEQKRESARQHIGRRLQYLYDRGQIDRVANNLYRLANM